MKPYLSLMLLGCLMIVASCKPAKNEMNEPAKLIPLQDFFKNPEQSAYQISPGGGYISYLAPYKSRKNIFVQKLGSNEVKQLTFVEERDLAGYFWESEGNLIYSKDNGGDENYHLYSVDVETGKELDLTPFAGVRAEIIDELPELDGILIVSLNKRNPQIFDPYRLDVKTGKLDLLAENPGNITSWYTDHEGKIRLAVSTDGVNTSFLYREQEQDAFKTVLSTNFKESLSPLFFSFDNQYIYALSNIGRDKDAVVKFDIKNGKEMELVYEHKDVDVSSLSYSRKRKVLTTIAFTTWKRQYHFLDETVKALYGRLAKDLGKYETVITSTNREEDKFIVRTYSDRSLGAYYYYEKSSDKLEKLADVSPWLDENELCEMKPIEYKSRDGLTIHGYLTLPKGKPAKNLPVVVNPHGGPWARDSWGFNPEIQFLANRGYAVLQMNFRGSTGYGRKFWEASFKEWGLTMQNDITDGVNWLIKEGVADKDRIAIYGASYGGYATLAGITLTPDVYACAIDYVGVSNLFTFMGTIPPYWEPYRQMLYEMVGDPSNEADSLRMRETSPVFLVNQIKTPLLIVQGAKDPRVNQAESDQMVAALKEKGIEVEYLLKENEGHGFRNEENKFELYETMEQFLAKHLKAGEK